MPCGGAGAATAGFTAERRLAVMACAQGEVLDVATPPGIDLLLARTEDQLRTATEVQNEAYGVDTTEDVDVARLGGASPWMDWSRWPGTPPKANRPGPDSSLPRTAV